MPLSIKGALRGVKPDGSRKKNESLTPMYKFVREHLSEIEGAYEAGYSWEQIDEACRKVWKSDSKRSSLLNWWTKSNLTEYSYREVKKQIIAR